MFLSICFWFDPICFFNASNTGAQRVNTWADKLARMAAQLQEMVGRFKVETP